MTSDLYQAIGERIRRARESVGVSQLDLARKIGYSSSATISHFESGERKISIVDLQQIAQILGLPTDYFFQNESQFQELGGIHLRALAVRPTAREPVLAFLVFAQKHSRKLEQIPQGIEKLRPSRAAESILSCLKIEEPPVSPRDVAIKLGVPVFEWEFPDEISGIFVSSQDQFCIGVNEAHPRVRQRFSTAHEIGHLVFDRARNVCVDFTQPSATADLEKLQDAKAEARANQFAADLLMPASWLRQDAKKYGTGDLAFLAKRYEVSQQALWFRLLTLKLVTEVDQLELF
ncbi:helix-turn-helix domain-containing protein [Leptolyngbya sp. AN03gr2]|uniref:helix-turn-helix domain-containing protein n=1 Tax=unclassified Leptolyngbya TaxID=2650499 RepID=UPI003D313FF8